MTTDCCLSSSSHNHPPLTPVLARAAVHHIVHAAAATPLSRRRLPHRPHNAVSRCYPSSTLTPSAPRAQTLQPSRVRCALSPPVLPGRESRTPARSNRAHHHTHTTHVPSFRCTHTPCITQTHAEPPSPPTSRPHRWCSARSALRPLSSLQPMVVVGAVPCVPALRCLGESDIALLALLVLLVVSIGVHADHDSAPPATRAGRSYFATSYSIVRNTAIGKNSWPARGNPRSEGKAIHIVVKPLAEKTRR